MYKNPVTQENVARLAASGWHLVGPDEGRLARGNVGVGRLAAPERIVAEAAALLAPKRLTGRRVLVSAGGTREPLDPVRYLGNRSSGRMGYALAETAARRGATTTLVSAPSALAAPFGVDVVRVERTEEMRAAMLERAKSADVVLMAAAPADFRFAEVSETKLKKRDIGDSLTLHLVRNADILAELGASKRPGQVLVGFAAETGDAVAPAREKLREKRVDLVVANDVTQSGAGFDVSTNIVTLVHADGRSEALPQLDKRDVAAAILDRVETLLGIE